MADFSLRTLFVVPVGNTLPTSGSSEALTAQQFGLFKDDTRTIATAGNVTTAGYIQAIQGQPNTLYLSSKVSDKIKLSKVKNFYKVTGQGTASNQILEFSNFVAECDEQVSITVTMHSNYVDTISFNGLTRSVTVNTPCCDCGADPCAAISNETIIDLIMAQIAKMDALPYDQAALKITSFLTFEKKGSGSSAVIRVTGKPLTIYGVPCDIAANPFEFDRLWFRAWVYTGPATTVDFLTADRCESAGTTTVLQRASLPLGTSAQIKQMEIDYQSYQTYFKSLYRTAGYNQLFTSNVTDGTIYNVYYIIFDEMTQDSSWNSTTKEDETTVIAVPQGADTTIAAILTAYLGAPVDESASIASTTTTTSTTSTTTSTTTTLIP